MNVTFKKFAVAVTTALAVLSTFQANAGKEMVVSYKNDVSTLDPAIGYDWQNWSMIKSLFDGLMDYKPGTTELKMDVAEEFDISSDGLVYTFKQQDLKAIGIKAAIKSSAQANVIAAGGEADQAPMIWSGGMAWIADFPDPANFYGPILGCGGAVPGGWNWSCVDPVHIPVHYDVVNASA